jgi:hypothetical protein
MDPDIVELVILVALLATEYAACVALTNATPRPPVISAPIIANILRISLLCAQAFF